MKILIFLLVLSVVFNFVLLYLYSRKQNPGKTQAYLWKRHEALLEASVEAADAGRFGLAESYEESARALLEHIAGSEKNK